MQFAILKIVFLWPTPGFSVDRNMWFEFAKRDDFGTASREWEPLAKLGSMYLNGTGVTQDDKQAVFCSAMRLSRSIFV